MNIHWFYVGRAPKGACSHIGFPHGSPLIRSEAPWNAHFTGTRTIHNLLLLIYYQRPRTAFVILGVFAGGRYQNFCSPSDIIHKLWTKPWLHTNAIEPLHDCWGKRAATISACKAPGNSIHIHVLILKRVKLKVCWAYNSRYPYTMYNSKCDTSKHVECCSWFKVGPIVSSCFSFIFQ